MQLFRLLVWLFLARQELRLDAVVTVADSKNLTKRLDDTVEEGKAPSLESAGVWKMLNLTFFFFFPGFGLGSLGVLKYFE